MIIKRFKYQTDLIKGHHNEKKSTVLSALHVLFSDLVRVLIISKDSNAPFVSKLSSERTARTKDATKDIGSNFGSERIALSVNCPNSQAIVHSSSKASKIIGLNESLSILSTIQRLNTLFTMALTSIRMVA